MKPRLRVMTYNAHSCVGTDGKLDPARIGEVIALYDPDIVALQELDQARMRSGQVDQAARIAEHAQMTFQFHPAMQIKEEQYGDAILSKHPMKVCRAGVLPTANSPLAFEPRGALWVSATVGDLTVQILNTHLGLSGKERMAQVAALIGPDWLGHPDCRDPVIFCGDLNALPNSGPHRLLCTRLRDAHRHAPHQRRPTFPSKYPLLRLDYVFVSKGLEVLEVQVPRGPLTRLASDHLPVIVDLALSPDSEHRRSPALASEPAAA